ncbi:MAG: NAD-dependent epimerase/dehydratase family protein [Peptococcaceae bacterium]|nr:NAD-dependent epimerase/dehydratase family protein [Peptococcaceae bacterium]
MTGVTGGMGLETARQLLARSDRFDVRALARPSKANQSLLKEFASDSAFEVVWGDMNDENAIRRCVAGADYVLHIGAFVSPAADKDPAQTLKTNLGSTRAIIKAIKAQPNPDGIKLAYIGTIAETGDRSDPIHWGRCGDPIKSSVYDYYAVSKIASEREVFESGLKYWVSLRQTGINPPKESAGGDPIIFHQPPNNVLEWITATESGIMMANLCEDWVPEEFWRSCYNIGGGKEWRLVNWEFVNKTLAPLGLRYEDVYDPRQMALYNFHGHWYTDSDVLNDFLRFRCITPDMFYAAAAAEIEAIKANPALAAMLPTAAAMRANNEAIGHQERGFHWMFETNQEGWIKSFFGSRAKQAQIKSFAAGFELYRPSEEPVYLKHGYDESKPLTELNLEDMKGAAIFRGGACLSKTMTKGDLYAPLRWRCAFGHEFDATPNLILRGGHWCPECERSKWNYAEIAKVNPFFAQVWNPIHGDGDEDAVVVVKEFNDQSV